ncbi:MAG TPA: hypothetical protein VLY04_23055 [Bryobacteraceae bacterium]|nr:hypothetical protein [Bryobacteraceae bacterium]
MIAAVKRWHAAFSALLFLSWSARAADDTGGSARELARKAAAFAGRGALVAVSWRNLSSLDSAATSVARAAFETTLQEAGVRISDIAPAADIRITLSESASQYMMVAEAAKGEERQVWIASWKRSAPAAQVSGGAALEKKLVWEQEEEILDLAFPATEMLVLAPSKLTLYARANDKWEMRQAAPLSPPKPWPRDVRGRLRVNGKTFQASLPGMACSGATAPALSMDCQPSDEPWVLESGSRALLLANYAASRNYFDGRVVTQSGVRKTVPPFFSAASTEDQGRTVWLLAGVDGRTQIFDAAFEPAGAVSGWGSDIAGTEARCAAGSQVLATRAGDRGQPDDIQAFAIVNRTAAAVAAAVDLPGPVTALWPSGGTSVLAVVRDLRSGNYAAYVVTMVCGN